MKKFLFIFINVMLIAATLLTTVGAAYTPIELDEDNFDINQDIIEDETFVLGDVNGDELINSADSYIIKCIMAGFMSPDEYVNPSDIDADGQISSRDSYLLKLCLAGQQDLATYDGSSQIYKLTIGGNDISEYSIVVEEECQFSDNEYLAAELFQEYISYATGNDLDIVRGTAENRGIYIHDVDKDSELGRELGNEGYKYEVKDGDLHLYGTDRGNMYGAFEIIEDYLGYGFIENYYSFLYKQRTVDIEEGLSVTFVPGYRFRQSKSTYNSNEDYRMRFHIPRAINGAIGFAFDAAKTPSSYYGNFVGSPYICIHSMNHYYQMASGIMPDESYGTLEQRYYAKYTSGAETGYKDETKWEPCVSDEDEYNIIFTGFVEYTKFLFEGKQIPFLYEDGTTCVSFSPCDNQNWCACRNCKPKKGVDAGPHYADMYLAFKNRGAEDIQEYYPGVKVYTLMYEKFVPPTVKPSEHLIIVLGGNTCANHPLGTDEECPGNGLYNMSKDAYEDFLTSMVSLCDETGAELWMWYYPDTNSWWLYDIPNIHALYYDVTWVYQQGITGFYYEGHNMCPGYTFENLKAYMFSQVAFDPEMTIEEYDELIKDYLYKMYGQGWENIWEFILMYEEAGELVGYENGGTEAYCYVGAYDRAFDVVSFEYIRDNYETMRDLIIAAIDEYDADKRSGSTYGIDKLNKLLCVFDLLGLGATYVSSYKNGDEQSRLAYEERYAATYEFYKESGMSWYVNKNAGGAVTPETINLDTNPFIQFTGATMRPHILALLQG